MATIRLDRIEGDRALLVHDGRPFELPVGLLPADAREGDVLELVLTRDAAACERARAATAGRRARLARDDDGGDFSL